MRSVVPSTLTTTAISTALFALVLAIVWTAWIGDLYWSSSTRSSSSSEPVSTSSSAPPNINMTTSRSVVQAVLSRLQQEGVGAQVRRSIGGSSMRNFDPFLLLDEFHVKAPAGFPDHPHRGFETVTYMLQGKVAHEDFAGHAGTIGPGDLQWMTAGRGIVHAEMPVGDEANVGLQLWINLPRKEKMCQPRYQGMTVESRKLLDKDIPHALPEPGIDIKVIAGESHGVKSPVYTKTPTIYLDFKMEAGKTVKQTIPADYNAFIYSLEGRVKVGTDPKTETVDAHSTIILSKSDTQDHVEISTTATESAHFVLIAGRPNNEPIVQHGPFVMCSEEEIQQTFRDYQNGKHGFERAKSFASKIASQQRRR